MLFTIRLSYHPLPKIRDQYIRQLYPFIGLPVFQQSRHNSWQRKAASIQRMAYLRFPGFGIFKAALHTVGMMAMGM